MFTLPQDILSRIFGAFGGPDDHLVIILQGLEPGLDVGGGVPEGLFAFDTNAVA